MSIENKIVYSTFFFFQTNVAQPFLRIFFVSLCKDTFSQFSAKIVYKSKFSCNKNINRDMSYLSYVQISTTLIYYYTLKQILTSNEMFELISKISPY